MRASVPNSWHDGNWPHTHLSLCLQEFNFNLSLHPPRTLGMKCVLDSQDSFSIFASFVRGKEKKYYSSVFRPGIYTAIQPSRKPWKRGWDVNWQMKSPSFSRNSCPSHSGLPLCLLSSMCLGICKWADSHYIKTMRLATGREINELKNSSLCHSP